MHGIISRLSLSLLLALGAQLVLVSHAEAAVTAQVLSGRLHVLGDDTPNVITLRVGVGVNAFRIQVLDGTTVVGSFLRSGFTNIWVEGAGGADTILLSRVNGEITETAMLAGGLGNDTITGDAGNDLLSGGPGDDRLIWNPGDGSDFVRGEEGTDTLEVNGSDAAELFTVNKGDLDIVITRGVDTPAPPPTLSLNVGTIDRLEVTTYGGNDSITCAGNLSEFSEILLNTGDGDDTIIGSTSVDAIIAGNGNDTVEGGPNNDVVFGGAGDDRIIWRPGHGSDDVEGQEGADKLVVYGTFGHEAFYIAPASFAQDARVLFTHRTGVVDHVVVVDDVESVEVNAGDSYDIVNADSGLARTDVTSLILDGGDGDDLITGSDTNDILKGGLGADRIFGGGGDDTIIPGPGDDITLVGGAGNDTLIWNDGDGRDEFDGGPGADTLAFNGSAGNEVITIEPSAPGVVIYREIGPAAVGLLTTEVIVVSTLGGNDTVSVRPNLTGIITIDADLGPGADTLNTVASSTVVANGNRETDTLNFDPQQQPVSATPSTISVAGVAGVTHVDFEQINLPDTPPTLTITSPTVNAVTTATTPFVTLAGTAADATGIATVTWVTDRGGSGTATGTTSWSAPDIPLFAGANAITVTATDTAGNQATDVLTVAVDTFSYTMAEGATGAFFDTDILIANPNNVQAPITITYLKGDGTTIVQHRDLPATSRTTIAVDAIPGLEDVEVSSTVTSNNALPLVVERTMRWDASGYGAHTERATDAPTTMWYFAEGSQGFFRTFVLLANPGTVSNDATITFLLEGGAPVVKSFALPPTSRQTVDAGTIPELANQSFGIVVAFTQPGVAERAMYFSAPGAPIFSAGHESAGVDAPSAAWFLAEGATGSFFTTFVLLANPGASDAIATVTFLPATGQPITKTHRVDAGRRVTLNIATEDPSLADSPVATQVVSTHPILVERAQYWPSTPDRWYEAHNSFGGTALGPKWGLAEGRVGGPEGYQTYILLANASLTQAADVTITFLRGNGTTVTKSFTVNQASRFNVHVNSMAPELANESFGALILVTNGPGIFVERALYADSSGVTFAAGTNALATRLP